MITIFSRLKPQFGARRLLRDVAKSFGRQFLQAFHILPLDKNLRPGMYWARDSLGRWELRVPARSLYEAPPA